MIISNSGGLITRGLGIDSMIITRGMSGVSDLGAIFRRKIKEYDFYVSIPVKFESAQKIEIYSDVRKIIESKLECYVPLRKEMSEFFQIVGRINHKKLIEILKEI